MELQLRNAGITRRVSRHQLARSGLRYQLALVSTMTAVVWRHPRLIDQRHDEATTSYRDPFTVFPTFLPATFARQQAQVSDLAALDAEDFGLECLPKAALAGGEVMISRIG